MATAAGAGLAGMVRLGGVGLVWMGMGSAPVVSAGKPATRIAGAAEAGGGVAIDADAGALDGDVVLTAGFAAATSEGAGSWGDTVGAGGVVPLAAAGVELVATGGAGRVSGFGSTVVDGGVLFVAMPGMFAAIDVAGAAALGGAVAKAGTVPGAVATAGFASSGFATRGVGACGSGFAVEAAAVFEAAVVVTGVPVAGTGALGSVAMLTASLAASAGLAEPAAATGRGGVLSVDGVCTALASAGTGATRGLAAPAGRADLESLRFGGGAWVAADGFGIADAVATAAEGASGVAGRVAGAGLAAVAVLGLSLWIRCGSTQPETDRVSRSATGAKRGNRVGRMGGETSDAASARSMRWRAAERFRRAAADTPGGYNPAPRKPAQR